MLSGRVVAARRGVAVRLGQSKADYPSMSDGFPQHAPLSRKRPTYLRTIETGNCEITKYVAYCIIRVGTIQNKVEQ